MGQTMANLQIRVDDSLKVDVNVILDDMGLDMTTAVRMFFKEIVRIRGLPFKPTASDPFYNPANIEHLKKALDDVRNGRNIVRHTLIQEK